MVGEIVGSYRIERELGIGGMGAVYLAKHTILEKWAAVKMLRPQWSKDPEAVDRFFTEATATTAVRHGGIVDVYDFGHHASGSAYLVMELLDGETFGERIRRETRLPEVQVLSFGWQAARALAAAHAADIVHRDLKPDNIFLCDDPAAVGGIRVKLLDFGIAKLRSPGAKSHTLPGELVGTPLFMSPEHCLGKELDGRSDVYSIACVLFYAISGQPPFVSEEFGELLKAHVTEPPPHLTEVWDAARPEVSDLLHRCMQKDPAKRPDALGLGEALRSLADAPFEITVPPRENAALPAPAPTPAAVAPAPPTGAAASSSWMTRQRVAAALALVLGLVGIVVVAVMLGRGDTGDADGVDSNEPETSANAGETPETGNKTADKTPETADKTPETTDKIREKQTAQTTPASDAAVTPAAAAIDAAAPASVARGAAGKSGKRRNGKSTRGSGTSKATHAKKANGTGDKKKTGDEKTETTRKWGELKD